MMPRHPSVPNLISELIDESKVARLARPPERLDDLPHVLGARSRAHQERVLRIDDNHVFEADRRHEAVLAKDEASTRVHQDGFALHRVAVIVRVHAVEEIKREAGWRHVPDDEVDYDGPPLRPLGRP